MSVLYEPRLRPERLIAAGRVALAVASLFAVWFDVSEPVRFVALTYGVLITYVVFSVTVAAVLWRSDAVARHLSVASHAVDLACCALLVFCTEGPSSPFNSLFVFALLSATLRWRTRGTWWTAGVVMVAFLASGTYFGLILADPDFDLRAFIIRGVYLIVLAALLHYVGTQEQRTIRDMSGLAEWPHSLPSSLDTLTRNLLEYAAGLMDAPRVVLRWTEADGTGPRCATWDGRSWSCERLPDARPLVRSELRGRAFLSDRASHIRTLDQDPFIPSLTTWQHDPAGGNDDPSGGLPLLVVPLRGENCSGHLLVVGKHDATLDDLVLAEIVGDVIASRLDAFYLTERLRQTATLEERNRLARDLHDGVLQSFTGIALRLAAIQHQLGTDQAAAMTAVEDLQRILASEQRGLRFFIQELRPSESPQAEDPSLDTRLRDLARLMELEWDLRVDLQIALTDPPPSATLARDIYHIIREGLINAARHGNATDARVTVDRNAEGGIELSIADNGRGFPIPGRFTGEDLARRNFGPKTLRERITSIHGGLSLESGPTGATLRVVLPMETVA